MYKIKKYTKKEKIKILNERIDMLQGQIDNKICLIGNPEEHFTHLRQEVKKATDRIATF